MRSNDTPDPAPTFESVWASLMETRRLIENNAEQFKETRRLIESNAEQQKETDRLMKENEKKAEKSREDYNERMKKLQEQIGGWANNHGSFAEEYFFNSFENDQQDFFGEHFNRIRKNVKPVAANLEDEYDIVMYNDKYVVIIEVKFTAHKNDIPSVLKKAETFRILCPDYKDFKIYLGLASLSFYRELEEACIQLGIAVIKQVGDTVVINDSGLKVF
jgi:hypothetical protein